MGADKRARNKGRASGDGGRHVRLYQWLTDTPAWRDLDATARCGYIELLSHFNGGNNGRIGLGIRALAESLNVAPKTAARALKSLEVHGFIVTVKRGAFTRKVRHASEYRLTALSCDVTGTLPTKDFARWQKNTVSPGTPNGAPHDTERCTS